MYRVEGKGRKGKEVKGNLMQCCANYFLEVIELTITNYIYLGTVI